MTAIAGTVRRGVCWLAGDSAVSDETGDRSYSNDPKVWRAGAYVIGAAGDSLFDRALLALHWRDDPAWFAMQAQGAITAACTRLEVDTAESEAVIGYRGQFYYYHCGALYSITGYGVAIGSAAPHLRGWFAGAHGHPRYRDPAALVRAAVRSAAKHCDGVGGRITVVHNGRRAGKGNRKT